MRTVLQGSTAILAVLALLASAPAPGSAQSATSENRANWELAAKFSSDALERFDYSSSVQSNWINDTDSLWYRWEDGAGARFQLVLPKSATNRPLFDHVRMAEQLSEELRTPIEAHDLPILGLEFQEDGHTLHFQADSTFLAYDLETGVLSQREPDEGEEIIGGGGRGGGRGRGGGSGRWRNFSPDSTAFAFARDHNLFVVEVESGDTIQLSTDGEEDYSFGSANRGGRGGGGGGRGGGEDDEDDANGRVRASVSWSPDSRAFHVGRTDSREVSELYLVNVLADPRPELRSYRYSMPGEENVSQRELFLYIRGDDSMRAVPVEKWKDQRLSSIDWTTGSDVLRLIRRDRLQWNQEYVEVDTETLDVRVLIRESVKEAHLERQGPRYVFEGGDIIWWSERTGWGHYYLYDHDGNLKNAITSGEWRAESIAAVDSIGGQLFIRGVGREPGENAYNTHLYRVNLDGSGLTLLDAGDANHRSSVSPSFRYVLDNSSRVDRPGASTLRSARDGEVIIELEEQDLSGLEEYGWAPPEPFVVKAADGITDIYGVMWKPFDFDPERKYPIIAHVYPGPQTESVSTSFSATRSQQELAQLGFIVIQIGNRGGSPQRSNRYHSFGYYNLRDYGLADKKAGIEQLAARHPFIDIERVGIYGHSGGGFMTAAALLQKPYNEFFKVGVASAGNHDNNVYNQNWSEQHHGLRMTFTPKAGEVVADDSLSNGGGAASSGEGARGASAGPGDGQERQARRGRNGNREPVSDAELLRELHERHVTEGDLGLEEEYDIAFDIHVPANHELAENLQGRLLLVHGDMDNNVHPAGTIRLADALIDADKRFDLFIMPGSAHGFGRRQGYFQRMLQEYFAEHLMGDYYRGSARITRPANGGGGGD